MNLASAIFFIVISSWILYRFVAPRTWREWSGAGLVQAFLIAFYAEMFGFPLTLYILVRIFKLDITPTAGGNLWVWLTGEPAAMLISMALGWGLFLLPGLAVLAEGWREIHAATRSGRLATDGLYGLVRHPQYTGIFMVLFGEGVVHWPTVFSVALFPVMVGAYAWLARREEAAMVARFGRRYLAYQARVPMFVPRWRDVKFLLAPRGRGASRARPPGAQPQVRPAPDEAAATTAHTAPGDAP